MPEENKIDYTGIQVPNIESVRKTMQQFTDWRRSMGFSTEEEKNAALKAEMQAAQQRFNDQDLWNSEDPYEVYNVYETDPAKQAEFQRNGQMVAGVGSTIATLPFTAGMMGWVPALTTTATGVGGGYAGAYGGQKLGQYLDNKYGWNTTPWLSTIGGIGGGILGGGMGYRGIIKLGSRGWLPKGGQTMYGKQFIGDVAADGINRNIRPISQFNKTVLQKRMDAYTSDSFVRDKLWFPQNIDEAKIRVEPEWDYVTSPQKDIFESPRTLIHWDGAATGNNNPKNVLTIGRPISKMTGVAHFENGKLVPAKTAIDVKKGPSFDSTNHPLMFSDYEPWFETPLAGRHLDWLDRFGDEKMWKWRLSEHGDELYTDYPHRIITIDSDTPGIKIQRGAHFGNRNSHEYYTGSIPISKIKEGFEWDPTIKTWGRVRYVDPSKTSSKGSYTWFERPSKLTWEERLGIPKGERNQPGKPRSPRAVEYDVVDGRPTKEFLDDYHTYVEALKTGGRRVDITDMFDSSWYRQRLLNQGLTEEQANQLILRLKDRVSPENLVVVDGLNSVRNFRRVEDGIPIEMTPERLTEFGRHTTGPGLSGKSLISLTTKADPEEIILHEIGGHRSQPLVADFNDTYLDQSLTNLGLQRHMKIGKTADYGLNWGEVRARALTIAKQMSDAGWNPNSPEQINVWLNKHIFTNSPKNANQGALYYDRPRFIKAVATGLKQGGKIENPGQ